MTDSEVGLSPFHPVRRRGLAEINIFYQPYTAHLHGTVIRPPVLIAPKTLCGSVTYRRLNPVGQEHPCA
jgi:hypothetical protein